MVVIFKTGGHALYNSIENGCMFGKPTVRMVRRSYISTKSFKYFSGEEDIEYVYVDVLRVFITESKIPVVTAFKIRPIVLFVIGE
jgi:hypothetical protein